ncbi:alpha-1-antiproteinase 2-like [Paramacrobiotus metropolitanus]|uniref:alpha-1-antiproteinase 2-like n=1 Tax=Paramacrobiotus metropolitanus TaxID=2943436 RepID=UPI0024462120|nr:alpha-1-antiproteinase 2-like [Paramacrobiotus metropolitanus]
MSRETDQSCELAFAVDLYKAAADTVSSTSNLIISPYSVESVLACLLLGTEGEIHERLWRLICPNGRSIKELCEELFSPKANGFTQANAVFYDQRATLTAAYRDALQIYEDIQFVGVPFESDPQQTIEAVNNFLQCHSSWKIHDILPRLQLDQVRKSDLILLSTIDFSGEWDFPFDPDSACHREFYWADGRERLIPFLNSEKHDFRSYNVDDENAELTPLDPKVLILDIKGNHYSVMFLLPEEGPDCLRQLENRLSGGELVEWRNKSSISEIMVTLPKFRISTTTDLIPCTTALGLADMYRPSWNMSGMFEKPAETKVADFAQNAMFDVDEYGIKAATVTILRSVYTCNYIPAFEANRPFLLIIWDNNAEFPLFMGRIADPTPTL